jgi:hypothetical protein
MRFVAGISHFIQELGTHVMNPRREVQRTCLKALAIVTMADGVFKDVERITVSDFITLQCRNAVIDGRPAIEFYDSYVARLQGMIEHDPTGAEFQREVDQVLESIVHFPKVWKSTLLEYGQLVADQGGVTPEESLILQRLYDALG